ncbi:hypothetical protein [Stenotrophomonas mori]|uniref:Integral membrane protein n=1 Tax=Stenotrophomonas mori TaxID=2871096 RepID=A0ABT0SGB1_9GAMM|nr:hypothetical protein [Stenotrophomonas mori]MCL7714361.1 hypothetical protein [Stenotrophomonas mori]
MDGHNPYERPATPVAPLPTPPERDVPDSITGPIRQGWIAACVALVLVLLIALYHLANNRPEGAAAFFIDLVVIAVLAFGIYKRSRTAATFMVLMSVLPKLLLLAVGQFDGLVFGLLFTIFYFRAMTATYRYHRFVRNWRRAPPAPRRSLADDPAFSGAPRHPAPAPALPDDE